MLQIPAIVHGLLAISAMNLLLFSALVRGRYYNVFLYSHIVGSIVLPIALILHRQATHPWVFAALGLYGLDYLFRTLKTRICSATLRPIPELGITRVEIPHLNAGWRPGQHVRLRVLSTGVGIFGWAEIHPFTISSVTGDGLTLMVKKAGDWTTKLHNMATKNDAIYSGGWGAEKKVKVWIEGPYGGVGNTMMDSYSGAVFMVGGSGITFALSSITDLVQKDAEGSSRLKIIHLIWSIQDPGMCSPLCWAMTIADPIQASLQPMIPTFAALLQQVTSVSLLISVHYTRASMFKVKKAYPRLPPRLTITPGRPKLVTAIGSVVDYVSRSYPPSGREYDATDRPTGVFVGVCGPVGLGDEARRAVGAIDPTRFQNVGGIEIVEETFGW